MKTSLLYKRGPDAYDRACLPTDSNPDEDERRIARYTVRYIGAHQETGFNIVSLEPYRTKPFTRIVPECVSVGVSDHDFVFKHGVADGIKVAPAEYVAQFDAIDREIDRLHRMRRDLMSEAWRRGQPLRKADLNGSGER